MNLDNRKKILLTGAAGLIGSIILRYLNEKLPKISNRFKDHRIFNVTSMLCFEEGSSYDINQINYKIAPWFNITDESNIINVIENTTSNEFILKNIEIDAILNE